MNISEFIASITETYKTGVASEHSYRPAIQQLINSVADGVMAINEPARVKCGAPDFIVNVGDVPVGHIEAKDIDLDISVFKGANLAQQKRYTAALPNLIYTNGLDWDFYRDGEKVTSVSIGDFLMGIQPKPEKFDELASLLQEFIEQRPQSIDTPRDLAERMAGKAQLIKNILANTLREDKDKESELANQYAAFKENLIHDITLDDFADIYAETIAYGMFAARLHDTTLSTFSRQEALELLPKSNPFLRSLFTYVAGYDLDDRIAWIIDDLALIFQACNVAALMEGFGKLTGQQDPFLHFYETFLAAYNPAKRKARGVWYTPEPVVNFIVRAVDEVLQSEFGLADGLADTSKVNIDWDTGQTDKKGKPVIIKKDVHRVQILDPATGTGTFLAEVIKQIAPKVKNVAPGMWSQYIEQDLIPRLHGFELLMASYAMCHMKLDMILTELGYKPTKEPPRLSVYLTNSLEEGEPVNQTLPFSQWLSREARGANTIKRDMPIMCVIGNPPYSIANSNRGTWISNLISVYKEGLQETSVNSLSDDYVKFIRIAETFISQNSRGVVAMITNNSFLDGVVHRQMRKHLRKSFSIIYVINLHGDSNKKETPPEGYTDENVFDIRQGVAITIAVKNKPSSKLANVKSFDLWGRRSEKYKWLQSTSLKDVQFMDAQYYDHYHFFTCKEFGESDRYEKGFSVDKIFEFGRSGIKFRKDRLLITKNFTIDDARQMVSDVISLDTVPLTTKYQFTETKDWTLESQRQNFLSSKPTDFIRIAYRPLDFRFTFYPLDRINRIIPRGDSRHSLMRHMIDQKNIALVVGRQNKSGTVNHFLAVDCPSEMKTGESTIQSYHFPLYLYPTEQDLDQTRRVNFDSKIHKEIKNAATDTKHGIPDEVQIFDYIYGVLHCPAYRETYADFLKINFPRIPWPKTPDDFWAVSEKGTMLRKLHLMEPDAIGDTPYPFKGDGDNIVDKPAFKKGQVWINNDQYFDAVPEISWDFYIGGYQPAQKWLKDRKGRALSFDDVKHYQRIIKILSETDRIMKTIEMAL